MRTDPFRGRGRSRGATRILLLLIVLVGGRTAPAPAQEAATAEDAAESRDRVLSGGGTIAAGEVVHDVAAIDGDLVVAGRITGNAAVVGGDLILEESGVVLGDVTVTGGRIVDNGGRVRGEMRVLDAAGASVAGEAGRRSSRSASAAAREAADDAAAERLERILDRRSRSSWFDPIRRGFAGLVSTVALGLVLAGLGAVLVFYGRPYLETVSDTLRSSTARSAGIGLAAAFLIIPAFVVMVVALAVSIVGIPVLLLAIPLYPLAIATAAGLGTLAAAHAIGERTAEQQGRVFQPGWNNSYAYLFTGLAMLLAPLIVADLVAMTGFLGFIGTLLKVMSFAVLWVVTTAGFGAVILSRAGTRRNFISRTPNHDVDDDPLFDEPAPRSSGV